MASLQDAACPLLSVLSQPQGQLILLPPKFMGYEPMTDETYHLPQVSGVKLFYS